MGPGTATLMAPIKHHQDEVAYNRQKQMAGDLQKWSPWTGLSGAEYMPKQAPSLFNSLQQGLGADAAQIQGLMGMMSGRMGGAGGTPMSPWSPNQMQQQPNLMTPKPPTAT